MATVTLSWGKCTIYTAKLGTDGTPGTWQEWATPAEDTTELTAEKGDKQEAKIEGGEYEAVKYKRNTYTLAWTIRGAAERAKVVEDKDGVIEGEYALYVIPEDATAKGIYIARCVLSLEDNFSTSEGIQWVYNADTLKPTDGTNQVQYAVYSAPTND